MNWSRGAAFALAAMVCAGPAVAQGIPGTRAYTEGRKGWDAIRDGRHQDAAAAFEQRMFMSYDTFTSPALTPLIDLLR